MIIIDSGKYIVSCSGDTEDSNIKVWDAKLQNLKSFKCEGEEIPCAVFHPKKENIIATTSSVGMQKKRKTHKKRKTRQEKR